MTARVVSGALIGCLVWLAGPCQAGSALVAGARAREQHGHGHARVLTANELEGIRGSATGPGTPRPWQYALPVLGGYGQLNAQTKNLHVAIPVVSIPGLNGGLSLALYFNTAACTQSFFPPATPPIANGWTHTYNVYLQGAGTTSVTVVEGDGSKNTFSQNMNGSFTAPAGVWDTLVLNGNSTYTLTRKSGLQLNFNSSHKLATLVDRNGNTTTVAYNGAGHVSTVTDPSSRQLTFSYNGSNLLTSVTDPASRTFSLSYTSNALTQVTYPAPATGVAQPYFAFTYSSFYGTLASFRNRRGSTWSITSGGGGGDMQAPYQITNPDSTTFIFGSATSVTPESGVPQSWTTDGSGNRSSVTTGTSMTYSGAAIVTQWTWDSARNMLTRTTPGGNVWEYTYDSRGNVLTVEDPLTAADPGVVKETYTYNSLDLPATHLDALGHETDFAYDTNGNLTTVTDPLLYDTTHTYSTAGLKLTTTDARGKVWSFTYDSYGNVTEAEDPLAHATTTMYNVLSLPSGTSSAAGVDEALTYDGLGRLKRITHEDSSYLEATYDGEDAVLTLRDENGKVTTNAYNSLGRLTSITDALSRVTSFTYNAMGSRTSLTNARSKTTTFTVDNAGRVILTEYPDGTDEAVTYAADGQVGTRTDGRAYETDYTYDDAGRLTGITYPTGTNTTFAYLANDARSEMTDRSGTTQWVYNARGEVTQADKPQGTINYAYLATGQRYSVGRSGGGTTYYTYDDAGRLTSLTNGNSETTTFTLNADGQTTQQTHANGTKALCTYSSTRGWLTALEHQQSNNTSLARYEYTRDDTGRITTDTQVSDHAVAYTYDDCYQLTAEARTGTNAYSISYTYDDAGNRLTKVQGGVTESYTYGDNNQVLTAGSKSYGYDANGNMTTVTVGMATTTLAWDYNDKLTGITYPNSSTNTFVTDDLGQRVSKVDSAGTTNYLYDGDRVLADSRADYTNGGVTGLISERAGSVSKMYHGDQLGSTRGLSNGSQAITDAREYDAWGLTVATSGGTATPAGFVGGQGYQTDADSGIMLLGARYYDPSLGRFISRDPVGYSGGFNLYSYCLSDPVNGTDPSGHFAAVLAAFLGLGLLLQVLIVVTVITVVAVVAYVIVHTIAYYINQTAIQNASKDGTLTDEERQGLQDIADKHGTEITVDGSRGRGEGTNVGSDLPYGHGDDHQSDIDIRIDPDLEIETGGELSDDIYNRFPKPWADVRPRISPPDPTKTIGIRPK